MLVTLAGMVMEVKFGIYENAYAPMLLRDEPASNVTDVKLEQPENALFPMLVTFAGMVIEVKPEPANEDP